MIKGAVRIEVAVLITIATVLDCSQIIYENHSAARQTGKHRRNEGYGYVGVKLVVEKQEDRVAELIEINDMCTW